MQPDGRDRRIEVLSTINTSSSGESAGVLSFTHNQNATSSNHADSPEDNSHHDRFRRERRQRNIDTIRQDPGEIEFFKLLHYEFKKAVHFFDRAIDEFTIREERVRQGIGIIKTNDRKKGLWNPLAKSVYRLYTDLLLLETFCIMTYCSFSKILKKHDKRTGYETRNAFMLNVVNNANFTNYSSLQEMIDRCKVIYEEISDQIARDGQQGLYEDERYVLYTLITRC
jgi:SPX domain protein involved in polyphosphate accumulation